jgi:hypothetical protein
MSGHAPGPWKYAANLSDSGFDIGPCLEDGTLDELALLAFTTTGDEEAEANARLMATSPELLEACQEILKAWKNHSHMERSLVLKVRAAVKKATGDSP